MRLPHVRNELPRQLRRQVKPGRCAFCERIEVVLVAPRNPLNIGAVARAMANFGFSYLTVVSPYMPHWREARSAVGAPELLQNAREASTIAEAVTNSTLVIGTGTLTYRKPEQPVVSLPALAPIVDQELARGGRIALIFGPEKHGLTREDLSWCQALVQIPTDIRQPSMNLGQAAAVCLYELASRPSGIEASMEDARNVRPPDQSSAGPVASGNLDVLEGLVDEVMVAANYSPRAMREANRHSVRLLLRRLSFNAADQRRVLGLFRRILWRLRRSPNRNVTD
jgi:tRNA/rRNA methyltransferase